jgi:alpha/beta superfamily hydrolase
LTEERVSFSAPDGLQLEGLLARTKGEGGRIILCHPHPLYGGDMFNNVITAMQGALTRAGFSTLRFNFRGVGGSEGEYGEGVREVQDVQGAVTFAVAEGDGPVDLAGYSFGAYVGMHSLADDDRVRSFVCISPPVAIYDFAALKEEGKPKLIIAGERDLICPLAPLEELFASLTQPKTLHICPRADHFWWGMEDRITDYMIDFLRGL